MLSSPSRPAAVVLVVEDEPLQRMMAADMAEDAGFDVVEAASAEEAIAILTARTDVRVVFTDIDMPHGMDGMKLAAAIRDRWPPIEIILTSGRVAPDLSTLPARAVFFPKPYRQREVVAAMRRMSA